MSARRRVPRRSVSGRTHRSAPTRGGERSEVNGNWYETTPCPAGRGGARPLQGERSRRVCPGRRGVVTPPYGSNTGGAQRRADVPKAWLPPTKFRTEIWGVSHGHRPLRKEEQATSTTRASGAQRSVCASGCEEMGGNCGRDHPQGAINLGQSLSHGGAVPAPFTPGSL